MVEVQLVEEEETEEEVVAVEVDNFVYKLPPPKARMSFSHSNKVGVQGWKGKEIVLLQWMSLHEHKIEDPQYFITMHLMGFW